MPSCMVKSLLSAVVCTLVLLVAAVTDASVPAVSTVCNKKFSRNARNLLLDIEQQVYFHTNEFQQTGNNGPPAINNTRMP